MWYMYRWTGYFTDGCSVLNDSSRIVRLIWILKCQYIKLCIRFVAEVFLLRGNFKPFVLFLIHECLLARLQIVWDISLKCVGLFRWKFITSTANHTIKSGFIICSTSGIDETLTSVSFVHVWKLVCIVIDECLVACNLRWHKHFSYWHVMDQGKKTMPSKMPNSPHQKKKTTTEKNLKKMKHSFTKKKNKCAHTFDKKKKSRNNQHIHRYGIWLIGYYWLLYSSKTTIE